MKSWRYYGRIPDGGTCVAGPVPVTACRPGIGGGEMSDPDVKEEDSLAVGTTYRVLKIDLRHLGPPRIRHRLS